MSRLSKVLRSIFPNLPRSQRRRQQKDDHVARIRGSLGGIDLSSLPDKHRGAKRRKYVDLDTFVPYNVEVCRVLNLVDGPRQFILDVGCGGGLFLYCAKYFGHDGIGIDIDNPLLGEMAEVFGVKRLISPVRKFEPLTVEGTFDLVTGINTSFDRDVVSGKAKIFWGCAEWHYFLSDVARRLSPTGRVFLRINRDPSRRDGPDYYDERVHRALEHGHLQGINYLFDRSALDRAIDNLGRSV